MLRAAHVMLLLGVAVSLTLWATASVDGAYSTPAAVRNILGFTGIALLAATALVSTTAWLPTVAFAVTAVVAGAEAGVPHSWAWPIRPNDDELSWTVAVALLVVGAAALLPRGPRHALP